MQRVVCDGATTRRARPLCESWTHVAPDEATDAFAGQLFYPVQLPPVTKRAESANPMQVNLDGA